MDTRAFPGDTGDPSGWRGSAFYPGCEVRPVPETHGDEQADRHQGDDRVPGDGPLSPRQHDKSDHERSAGHADVPADLEEGLGQPVPAARGHSGYSGCFRMENGGAYPDEDDRKHNRVEGSRNGEQEQAEEAGRETDGQRKGLGMTVRVETHHWLQKGGGKLIGECHQPYLAEVQLEQALEHGVDRRKKRRHRVVQKVAEPGRREDRVDRTGLSLPRGNSGHPAHALKPSCPHFFTPLLRHAPGTINSPRRSIQRFFRKFQSCR